MSKKGKAILQVLEGNEPWRMPIWLMRQAGRYLPEYRALRAEAGSFLKLCYTPELASEITLQPIRRFDFDAAILFADILLVPNALGLNLTFKESEGPVLERVDSFDKKALSKLEYDVDIVKPVFETVDLVKKKLSKETTLIGFCGAPWTVACYMIDGNSRDHFSSTKYWLKERQEDLATLMDILVETSVYYLSSQIKAGAEVVQIFDSWSGMLQGEEFRRWIIEPTKKLVSALKKKHPDIPVIGFPREAGAGYEPYIRETGVDALSIDQHVALNAAKRELQIVKPLQGNLDPQLLVQGGDKMKAALDTMIEIMGKKHIVNLGHGVVPETPPEHVAQLVEHLRSKNFDE